MAPDDSLPRGTPTVLPFDKGSDDPPAARENVPVSNTVVRLLDERNTLRTEIEALRQEGMRILQIVGDALEEALEQRESVVSEARAEHEHLAALRSERDEVERALRATREQLAALIADLEEVRSQRVGVLLRVEGVLREALEQRETLLAEMASLRREREGLLARPVLGSASELEPAKSGGHWLRNLALVVLVLLVLALLTLAGTMVLPLPFP